MPDITNINASNAVKSVGGTSQKNINNNPARPGRTPGSAQTGRGGRISNAPVNTEETYAGKINDIRENAVKTIKMDIVEKALRDADIEVTQETLNIVKSLVNGSLPLTDKNIVNLLEYSRVFQNVSTDVLALMMRLEIPMTAENVEQFEKLISANEKLSDKISELINKLPQEILQNSRNLSELSETLSKLLDIVSQKDAGDMRLNLNNSGNLLNLRAGMSSEPVLTRYELNGLLNMLRNLNAPDSVLNELINANRQGENVRNMNMQNTQNGQEYIYQSKSDIMLNIINGFIRDINLQEQSSVPANNAASASVSVNAEETEIFGMAKDLINSAEFQKLLKESMGEKWLINPKNFNPEKIEDFYNKLNENLNSIEKRFSKFEQNAQNNNQIRHTAELNQPNQAQSNVQSNPPQIFLDAKNIRDNLSLMNEISKTMPFMQIPVKFANQTVNSDLYIFTNKKKNKSKNGANSAGGINALLRLDLENAGTLEIYINMSGKNVRSRFYSKNMQSIREIEKYLPELDETVSKMGFNFKSVASSYENEKGFDFVSDFINRGVPKAEIRKYILNMKI